MAQLGQASRASLSLESLHLSAGQVRQSVTGEDTCQGLRTESAHIASYYHQDRVGTESKGLILGPCHNY